MGADCSTVEKFASIEAAPGDAPQAAASAPKSKRGRNSKEKTDSQDRDMSRADSTVSTQVPTEISSRSSAPVPAAKPLGKDADKTEKKIDKLRVENNLNRWRKIASETAGEINHFAVFSKNSFKSLDAGFDAIAGKKVDEVDLHNFVIRLEELEYTGDAEKVFHGMCDDQSWDTSAVMSRMAFYERLSSIGNSFRMVVRQALCRDGSKIKKKVAQAMKAKRRDANLVDDFRKFIEPRYATPGKCFDAIADDDANIDEDEFLEWLKGVDFPGDAASTFQNFCDVDGYITRVAFSEILMTSAADETKQSSASADGHMIDRAIDAEGDTGKIGSNSKAKAKAGLRRSRLSTSQNGLENSNAAATPEEVPPKRKTSKKKTISSVSPVDDDDASKEQIASKGRRKSSRTPSKEKEALDDTISPEGKTDGAPNGELEGVTPPSRKVSKRRTITSSSGSVDDASKEKIVTKKKSSKSSVVDESEETGEQLDSQGGKAPSAKKKAQRQRRNSV